MSKVVLTHRPTRDPRDSQPSPRSFNRVDEALAANYELTRGRSFHVGIELRLNGEPIYDDKGLLDTDGRIGRYVADGMTIEEAAKCVATEDGFLD